jgi:hypothetical protein
MKNSLQNNGTMWKEKIVFQILQIIFWHGQPLSFATIVGPYLKVMDNLKDYIRAFVT